MTNSIKNASRRLSKKQHEKTVNALKRSNLFFSRKGRANHHHHHHHHHKQKRDLLNIAPFHKAEVKPSVLMQNAVKLGVIKTKPKFAAKAVKPKLVVNQKFSNAKQAKLLKPKGGFEIFEIIKLKYYQRYFCDFSVVGIDV